MSRAGVRRFPYLIYYRIQPAAVEVIGVLHSSRAPEVWQEGA